MCFVQLNPAACCLGLMGGTPKELGDKVKAAHLSRLSPERKPGGEMLRKSQ